MTSLQFAPPQVVIAADLAWLLRAAFAEPCGESEPADATHALLLARRLELSGRIAERRKTVPESRPNDLRSALQEDYHNNLAQEALLLQALDRVAVLAERLGIPLMALKFAALRLSGVLVPGTRVAGDLDLLVPRAQAKSLWQALLGSGFARTRARAHAHQLEALVDPYGAVVELHVHLPGVFAASGRLATAEELTAGQLSIQAQRSILVPSHGVLGAHAIAHALLQNRASPQAYSPLRMLTDLADLRRIQPDVTTLAAAHLAPELKPTCEALGRLGAALSKGTFSGAGFAGTTEQILLWHCIAAREDHEYAERLRAAGLWNKFRDGSSVVEIVSYVRGLLFPAAAELDALYGPVDNSFARLTRRLRRPIDLTTRAARRWVRSRSR